MSKILILDAGQERTVGSQTKRLNTKQVKGLAWPPDGSQIVINFQHEGRLTPKTNCGDVLKNSNPAIPYKKRSLARGRFK